jgi:hypothetical protein
MSRIKSTLRLLIRGAGFAVYRREEEISIEDEIWLILIDANL